MMLGELIFADADKVYTPAVSSQGSRGMFTIEVTQVSGTAPTIDVEIQSKNHDEMSWTSAGAIAQLTTTGTGSAEVDVKEQVRLEYTMGGTNSWMRIRTYDAMWTP